MIVLFCSPGHKTEHDGGTLLSNEVGEILFMKEVSDFVG